MKRTAIAALVVGVTIASSAYSAPQKPRAHVICGVNLDLVEWSTFCPAAQPQSFSRSGVTCPVVHPASTAWRHYVDITGRGLAPLPPDCTELANNYKSLIVPDASQFSANVGKPWLSCERTWENALVTRCRFDFDDMPLKDWRTKYFGKWLDQGGKK